MCVTVLAVVMAMVAMGALAMLMGRCRVPLGAPLFFGIYAGRQYKPQ